jgi:molybdopterin molybdotransferase
VLGIQAAGEAQRKLTEPDGCLEAMTGAVLPAGCNSVIPVEQLKMADGVAEIAADVQVEPWQNIHRRTTDGRQGDLLMPAGICLRPPEIANIASSGMSRVRVSAQPAVIAISTGDELVEPGEPVLPHQIRRSNPYGIVAALRQRGFVRVADDHLPDDPAVMRERLRLHLSTHDVLIMSGGVSMGRFDFVPRILEELGVRPIFHRIAQRPGKPIWFGVADSGPAVFALPGNPVSTLVCLSRYVLPALFHAMGLQSPRYERIALAQPVDSKAPLSYFLPVVIQHDEWGRPWADPRPTHGSGDFTALAGTDGFVELPPGPTVCPKGFMAQVYRW